MAQEQKRIGLIGLSAKGSWASRAHIQYLRDTPHYTITALQNSSQASAAAAAKEYSLGNVSTYDNSTALAADPNVDIVAVSVNVPQHYSLVKPALEAGKDVFVEWPLARNAAEAEEFTKIAKEKGLKTLVGLQARQNPTIIKAKELVESGKLGKILGTVIHGFGTIFGPTLTEALEYALPVENGANLLTIPFGHSIDALCFVLGEVKELSATLANNRPEMPLVDKESKIKYTKPKTAHDYVSITGTLVNGGVVEATYVGGSSATGRDLYWEITGTEGTLVLEGRTNAGHMQIYQPTLKFFKASTGATESEFQGEDIEVEKYEGPGFNVGRAWDALAGVGLERGINVVTFEDALRRHRMIEAIYRSAENGTRESYL